MDEIRGMVKTKKDIYQKAASLAAGGYFLWIMGALPLAFRNAYYDIGDFKYLLFRSGGLFLLAAAVILAVCRIVWGRKAGETERAAFSLTDKAVAVYAFCVFLSWLFCDYRWDKASLLGAQDWYMGVLSQAILIVSYFFLSRHLRWKNWYGIFACIAAVIAFLIALLHRFNIDPLGLYQGVSEYYRLLFLGTIGQATWYSSYLCILLPIFMGIYFLSEKKLVRIASLAAAAVGAASAVTQNSDSAYGALFAVFCLLFWFAFESEKRWMRFWELLLVFGLTAGGVGTLQRIFPQWVPALDPLSIAVTQSLFPWIMSGVSAVIRGCSPWLWKKKGIGEGMTKRGWKKVRLACFSVLLLGILLLLAAVLLATWTSAFADSFLGRIGYLKFDDSWGNGRGRSWMFAWDVYGDFPLYRKLFGCGPDCFAPYAYEHYGERLSSMWGNVILTNAHNEWLTALVNYGLLGGAAYLAIFICGIRAGCRLSPLGLIMGAALLSYMIHNLFNYQQCICTPVIFVILGLEENFLRRQRGR